MRWLHAYLAHANDVVGELCDGMSSDGTSSVLSPMAQAKSQPNLQDFKSLLYAIFVAIGPLAVVSVDI